MIDPDKLISKSSEIGSIIDGLFVPDAVAVIAWVLADIFMQSSSAGEGGYDDFIEFVSDVTRQAITELVINNDKDFVGVVQ